jgi:hypothetical protein
MPVEHSFPATQYLRVIGRLHPDQRLQLRPGYLSHKASLPVARSEKSRLMAEVFDDEAKSLGRYALGLSKPCVAQGAQGGVALAVRGWVPFHPAAKGVRFLLDGRMVDEIRRNAEPPSAQLEWQPTGHVEGQHRVTWRSRAGPGSDRSLQFFLRYSCDGGRRWQRISLRTEEPVLEVDFDGLPGGRACMLMLVATDGIDTALVRSEPFRVDIKPLQVTIISPLDGGRTPSGQSVTFMGCAYSMEDDKFETQGLRWTSSCDGEFGRGPVLVTSSLSDGSHRIKLLAEGGNRVGSAEITLSIGQKDQPAGF